MDWQDFRDKKICVAVSGGADSVALLHQMKAGERAGGYRLCAVHCEHGIRGQASLDDMAFVQALCDKWELPLYLFSESCLEKAERERRSLETVAREFRRACFARLISEGKADFIATAHHLNDEAETVLFRLARGSSLTGMVAMKEREGYFLRPLLHATKAELLRYIEANGLSFREDCTNLETDATRNKLRLDILPRLEGAIPGATKNIGSFAFLAAEDDALLYRLSGELLQKEGEGWTVKFSEEKPLFTRACLTAMKGLGVLQDYTSAHLNGLFALQAAKRGAWLTLPKNIRAEKTEKGIFFFIFTGEENFLRGEEAPFTLEDFDGGRYEVKLSYDENMESGTGWKTLRLDEEKLPTGVRFRYRREGDEIRRFGGGTKRLKKFFNEEKIPPKERDYLPLLADEAGRIYVVCGVEISEAVRVDENTKRVLYLALRKKEK